LLAKADRLIFGGFFERTPTKFQGSRNIGCTPGSYLVEFSLLRQWGESMNEERSLSMELRTFDPDKKSSFGAVRLRSPIGVDVVRSGQALVVTSVEKDGSASLAEIRENDIIRAASIPDTNTTPWNILNFRRPRDERGLVFLEGKSPSDFSYLVKENARIAGSEAEIVLIIERPIDWKPVSTTPRRKNGYAAPKQNKNSISVSEVQKKLGDSKQFQQPTNNAKLKISMAQPVEELETCDIDLLSVSEQVQQGQYHRFIEDEEARLLAKADRLIFGGFFERTPTKFQGSRNIGCTPGSYLVEFSLLRQWGKSINEESSLSMDLRTFDPDKKSSFGQ
jgi:hypothetical protein